MSKSLWTEYYPAARQESVPGRKIHLFLLKDSITGNSFTYVFSPLPGFSPVVPVAWMQNHLPRWTFECNFDLDLPSFCVNPTPAHTQGYLNGVLTLGVEHAFVPAKGGAVFPGARAGTFNQFAKLELLVQSYLGLSYGDCGFLQRANVGGQSG